jgi:hypothetical protein
MARHVEGGTYTEHEQRVVEVGVECRYTGNDGIAAQEAFKERTLAQLREKIADISERPAWSGK